MSKASVPERPKKPLTGYFRFGADMRDKGIRANKDIKVEWDNLD